MGLAQRVDELPTGPGVYLFKSERGRVLYVGKAQNLRSRVRSYVTPGGDGRHAIPRLMARAADVDVVVTPSVKDALLLENELIKQHRPPFNVRLRDDKQYLALRLDPKETWPKLTQVRQFKKDGALYFGPYTSSTAMRESLSNLRRIFPLRSCREGTFRDYARRGRPCIEYEMRRCAGPCCGLVSAEDYAGLVEGTALFLRGRSDELVNQLQARMREAAAAERFEEAASLRDRIGAVEQTVARQQIVGEKKVDRDVFGLARRGGELELQVLHVRDGRVVGAKGYAFSDVDLGDAEVVSSFLGQYYGSEERPVPREVLTPEPVSDGQALESWLAERAERRVVVRAPQRGAGRELVAMAAANASLALERRLEAQESVQAALEELRERLGLAALPRSIECYDVSTLGGVLTVASRVRFEDGKPERNGYRRYRVRDVAAAGDDYASLREVIGRRLARVETEPLPDLLMVDGGKGQLGVLEAALRDAGLEGVDTLGLAKERDAEAVGARVRRSGGLKAERIFRPGRKDPLLLPPSSKGLLLLQRVRDESHRFAIEYQRGLRRRTGLTSILEELPGIGPGKRRALLRELGSLRAVREASLERLAAVPGVQARDAALLRRFFDGLAAPGDAEPEAPAAESAESAETAVDAETAVPDQAEPPEGR